MTLGNTTTAGSLQGEIWTETWTKKLDRFLSPFKMNWHQGLQARVKHGMPGRYVFWSTLRNTYEFTENFSIASLFHDLDGARRLTRSQIDWTPEIRSLLEVVSVQLTEGAVVPP